MPDDTTKKNRKGGELPPEDLLNMLKLEENTAATVGYGATARDPQRHLEPFQDSITCLQFAHETLEPCDECWLMKFVPPDYDENTVPCHQIPLNEQGDTVMSLEAAGDQERLRKAILAWVRDSAAKLEQELKGSK